MSKHNKAQLEKRERNEIYSLRFKKVNPKNDTTSKRTKSKGGRFSNWCRVDGHPASCSCLLPSREEVVSLSYKRR